MKKSITLFVALSCAALAGKIHAQDTLKAWNLFHANDIIVYGNNDQTLAPNVVPGSGGLGQTWTFTTTAFEWLDTMNVVEMQDVPAQYTAAFPQSNLALYYGSDQTAYDFVYSYGSSLYVNGSASLDPNFGVQAQTFSDPMEYLRWPMYYGITFADTAQSDWTYPTTGPNDSAREITMIRMEVQVDAQGTLVTSYGSYGVIRVRRDYEYWQTFSTHDPNTGWSTPSPFNFTARTYEWWTDSIHIGWMVASMQVNPANNAVQSYRIQTHYTVDVPAYTPLNPVAVYPNPATDVFQLSAPLQSRWEIIDLNGNVVKSEMTTSTVTSIAVGELPQGVYIVRVTQRDGAVRSERLCVVEQ